MERTSSSKKNMDMDRFMATIGFEPFSILVSVSIADIFGIYKVSMANTGLMCSNLMPLIVMVISMSMPLHSFVFF